VRCYTNAHTDNYLPPAGQFIPGSDSFRFAVLGDSELQNIPLEEILLDIKSSDFAFAMHVGDLADRVKTSHFEWLLQEFREELGDFPLYAVPGNHDDTKEPEEERLRYYKRAFGQPNYWFSYGDTLFVCLDTSDGEFTDAQALWLETTLDRLRDSFKLCVLFTHMPPFDPRPGHEHCIWSGVEQLKKIVVKYDFAAIITGHIHEYFELDFGGVPLYIVPPSGQVMRGSTTEFGYVAVAIDEEGSLSVKSVSVTDATGREDLEYGLSTRIQANPVVEMGLVFCVLGFLLAVRIRADRI